MSFLEFNPLPDAISEGEWQSIQELNRYYQSLDIAFVSKEDALEVKCNLCAMRINKSLFKTSCNHFFHLSCLSESLQNSLCPKCHKDIRKTQAKVRLTAETLLEPFLFEKKLIAIQMAKSKPENRDLEYLFFV